MDPFLSSKFSAPFAAHLPIGPAARALWEPWAQPRFGAVTNGSRSFPTAPSESVCRQVRLGRFWFPFGPSAESCCSELLRTQSGVRVSGQIYFE